MIRSLTVLFRRDLIQSVRFESSGFLADAEILHLLRRGGVAIEEVPVTRHARTLGASTIRWRHLPELVQIQMRRRAR